MTNKQKFYMPSGQTVIVAGQTGQRRVTEHMGPEGKTEGSVSGTSEKL
jgi:hypothetical protein